MTEKNTTPNDAFRVAAADAVRSARERAGLSRGQLADLAQTSESQISRWESGTQLARLDALARVAAACSIPTADLIPPADLIGVGACATC